MNHHLSLVWKIIYKFYLTSKGKSYLLIRKKCGSYQNIRRNTDVEEEEKYDLARISKMKSLKY